MGGGQDVNEHPERIRVRRFAQGAQVAEEHQVGLRAAALIRAIDRVATALVIRGIDP